MRVRVPSPRSGSIWKMPPWAQSLAWIFIDRPVPVRTMTRLLVLELDGDGAGQDEAAVVGHLAGEHGRAPTAGDVLRVGRAGERVVEHREVAAGGRRTGCSGRGPRTLRSRTVRPRIGGVVLARGDASAPVARFTSRKPPPSQASDDAAWAAVVAPDSASVADTADAATTAVGQAILVGETLGIGGSGSIGGCESR